MFGSFTIRYPAWYTYVLVLSYIHSMVLISHMSHLSTPMAQVILMGFTW